MTWTAGTSRAGYDHVGNWERRITLAVAVPDAVHGDESWPGSAAPGTFALAEDTLVLQLVVEVA